MQCYAPTNDSNDDDKDQFYERLQLIVAMCAGKDMMGDLNVKFGVDNTEYPDVVERHRLIGRNEREW
ncbi:unnamed protein product [Schistosoma mattheei]|uniref:Uncharacterized protein n=1 Tax=Schistosoma mattheei TaxID=31246 RepID=A0A183NK55_9TREM|nr:unnamed protein product [Schistosoma mattheei]